MTHSSTIPTTNGTLSPRRHRRRERQRYGRFSSNSICQLPLVTVLCVVILTCCTTILLSMFMFSTDSTRSSSSFILFVNGQTNLYRGLTGNRRSGSNEDSTGGNGMIDDIPTTTLSNGIELPLMGLGVGNLYHDIIETMIYEGLKSTKNLRLIDTAHASRNEKQVARGIVTGVKRFQEESLSQEQQQQSKQKQQPQKIQVHVVTKIWYTYLGYERTKIAVDEILNDLQEAINSDVVDLKIHLLLHWPQCYDHISWMDCEREENNLPANVKDAGPPPHLDRPNAWKESWRALEDIYSSSINNNSIDYKSIASIGVSNFEPNHIEYMASSARILPHLTQINSWNIINNVGLIEMYKRHNIHIQLYNVMNGFTNNLSNFPHAHHHLLMVANQLKAEMDNVKQIDSGTNNVRNLVDLDHVDVSQVILKYCLQKDYSTITRTSKLERLASNSAVAVGQTIPSMTQQQLDITFQAMKAVMNQRDMSNDVQVKVKFHAKESDLFVYWVHGESGEEHHVAFVENGSSVEQQTFPDHIFKVYHAYDPEKYETYSITKSYGETQEIHVEL